MTCCPVESSQKHGAGFLEQHNVDVTVAGRNLETLRWWGVSSEELLTLCNCQCARCLWNSFVCCAKGELCSASNELCCSGFDYSFLNKTQWGSTKAAWNWIKLPQLMSPKQLVLHSETMKDNVIQHIMENGLVFIVLSVWWLCKCQGNAVLRMWSCHSLSKIMDVKMCHN